MYDAEEIPRRNIQLLLLEHMSCRKWNDVSGIDLDKP